MRQIYESHRDLDPDFPIIFHLDTLRGRTQSGESLHWHENIELLFCTGGEGTVVSNSDRVPLREGELAVVNPGCLHVVLTEAYCQYYCLIIGKSLLEGTPLGSTVLSPHIQDGDVTARMSRIIQEMRDHARYYRAVVTGEALALMAVLCRRFPAGEDALEGRQDNQVEMVKSAIAYIRRHYLEELSIDGICRQIGFSKYYFCRTFKAVTGSTVVNYINFLRCKNARSLLSSGQCNISESAERSGFKSMSYFSRTYRAQMGMLPSETRDRGQEAGD